MGTLALTFDDGPGAAIGEGPGPRTGQIAQFLHGLGVRATFFCLGRHVAEWPGVLAQIKSFGHLIANHGYDHAHLAELEAVGGDVVSQVARGEAAIRPWLDAPKALFRAPYFGWSAAVANALNADLRTHLAHVGPLGGDIDGDWMYWGSGGDPADVAQHYLETIRARGRGIVVLHDSSADSAVARAGNGALEAVRVAAHKQAGMFTSLLPLSAMVATPLLGLLSDKIGKRASLMLFASVLLLPVYVLMGYTGLPLFLPLCMMGIAFSVIPAVMWPSVAYIVDRNRLGTAYALMTLIEQVGFFAMNLLIGKANDYRHAGLDNLSGYKLGMLVFSLIAGVGFVSATLLRIREAGPRAYGLETITAGKE